LREKILALVKKILAFLFLVFIGSVIYAVVFPEVRRSTIAIITLTVILMLFFGAAVFASIKSRWKNKKNIFIKPFGPKPEKKPLENNQENIRQKKN